MHLFQPGSAKKQPFNLALKLFDRQSKPAPPSAHINNFRNLYENLPPTSLVCKVEPPENHISRFTPSGEHLVAFGPLSRELIVYRHKTLNCSFYGDLPADWVPPNAASFSSHFQQLFCITLARGVEILIKDFLLTLHDERFLLVVKATPTNHAEGPTATGPPPAAPLVAQTTLVLINMRNGQVVDEYILEDDFVHVSHNFGIHLWNDLLLILGVRKQVLYILQVLPSGHFVKAQNIGPYCNDDDQLVLELQQERERQWLQQHPEISLGSEASDAVTLSHQPSEDVSSAAGPSTGWHAHSHAAASQAGLQSAPLAPGTLLRRGSLSGALGRGAIAAAPGRQPWPVAQPAHHSIPSTTLRAASGRLDPIEPSPAPLIEGLKHKMLVHLFKKKKLEAASSKQEALKQFHYVFENMVDLLMWKAQFLDRHLLLIALGTADTVMQRNMDMAPSWVFFLIYDIEAHVVLKVTSNNSDGMMGAYLQNSAMFHAADISNDWNRFITPCATGLQPIDQQEKLLTRQWGQQAVRRVLANIPVNSQVLCPSPFLDVNLFQYDDRHVSALVRPRVYAADSLLRFVSKHHLDKSFKMPRDCLDVPVTQGRPVKQIIHYHFHPVLPFAMFYLLTFIAGPQICIYTRY